MASTAHAYDRAAAGLGMGCAVVAQAASTAAPDVSHGAMYLGAASVIAAAGPHLMAALNRWFDDRKHARDTNVLDVVNQLRRNQSRIAQLEKIAETAGALEDKARETEARYHESQDRIAWLERYVASLTPAVADNQHDLQTVARAWPSPQPPALKAVTDPAPLPSPTPPPPPRSGSGDDLPIPPGLLGGRATP